MPVIKFNIKRRNCQSMKYTAAKPLHKNATHVQLFFNSQLQSDLSIFKFLFLTPLKNTVFFTQTSRKA